jgi:hypothetical protein
VPEITGALQVEAGARGPSPCTTQHDDPISVTLVGTAAGSSEPLSRPPPTTGRDRHGSADARMRRARHAPGRYRVSSAREEDTGEGTTSEGPGHAGALTWRGVEDVRGVSGVWRSSSSHRRAPPLTPPLSRLMSGARGSGARGWFRLRAGCGAPAGSAGTDGCAGGPSSGTSDHSADRWWGRHRTHVGPVAGPSVFPPGWCGCYKD